MLRRFWVEPEQVTEDAVTFIDDSFHHLIRVSRKKVGDNVEALDGRGSALTVEISYIQKTKAIGKILSRRLLPAPSKPFVNLAFCFPKPSNFELVLEKAVELGCHSLTPLTSEYGFVAKKKDFPSHKAERWGKIIKAATEQTGRADIMSLNPVENLDDFLANFNRSGKSLSLFLYEGESALDLRQHLRGQNLTGFDHVWALVGAEGGFSKSEVNLLKDKGFTPLTMGKQILRTETACVSILSILQYELGHLS